MYLTMFQPWRLKLREAEEALRAGRLDEAGQLLTDELREYLPAKRLLAELVARRMAEAERYLASDDAAAALGQLDALRRQTTLTPEAERLREAAGKASTAERLTRLGRFAEAERELAAAAQVWPALKPKLEQAAADCRVKGADCRRLVEQLHHAVATAEWTDALTTAESLLELCPDHGAARDARRRAWQVVGARLPDSQRQANPLPRRSPAEVLPMVREQRQNSPDGSSTSQRPEASGPRFLLWIDGVGGYLVCEGDEVVLGQPVSGNAVDIPILGDVSRRHARIRRDGEGYLIEPIRPVRVNGRTIQRAHSLVDGALIELGQGVQLRFSRPHALSSTARLDFVSRHRTQPSVDGIVLLSESCVLGPSTNAHIACRNWSSDVVIFRQGDELHCRTGGRMEIDGQPARDTGRLTRRSRLVGDEFSITLEELA